MIHAREDYDRIQDPSDKIPDDEPVFLIRAQDMISGDVLRDYSNRLERLNGDPVIIADVREHADKMDAWNIKKMPDLPIALDE